MRDHIKNCFSVCLFTFLFVSSFCFADEVADISKLIRDGKATEAMQKTEAALLQKPKDPQLRFLKGLMLAEQNKSAEAIAIFLKLTDDHPELPEPYNNLAVLYGANGQYDKSRAALEMAIRTNPTYGTAHENLGDVYAKLASQAYDKALQLDSANSAARLKLTLVRNLIGNTTGGTNPKTSANNNAVSASPSPAIASANQTAQKETQAAKKVALEQTKATQKPAEKPILSEQDDVLKAVASWAASWSKKDTAAYLSHYAKDFETPKGESRKEWAEERRARIESKGRIDVKIESEKVNVEGQKATVKFRQIYTSDRLTANSRKVLELVKQEGKWLIKQERTGS